MTTTPDPVTDVWELLWTAACDYRDANPPPHNSTARLIDALMPIVTASGDARAAEAEARGRAEMAQQLRDRHTRDGYGLCRECTTYGDDARDILEPVAWPCSTRHYLAAETPA